MSRFALGIDPGPTHNGWALLEFTIPKAPVWYMGGVCKEIGEVLELIEQPV